MELYLWMKIFTTICVQHLQERFLWQSNEQFVWSNTSTPAVVGDADWCASGKLLVVDQHLDLFSCFLRGQLPVV